MTTVYATWDDVNETFEGTIPDAQRNRVEALLRRASARLTQLVPSLPSRLLIADPADPLYVDPELPAGLVVDAVLRLVRNPSGVQTQNAGPFNQVMPGTRSATGAGAPRAEVWFDEAEVQRQLMPVHENAGAGTFRVGIPMRPLWPSGLPERPYWWPSSTYNPPVDLGTP